MMLNKCDPEAFDKTVEILNKGGVVILPTDTVYGFSASSNILGTDEKIRIIKGRSEDKPFIQLIANPEDIYKFTKDEIPTNLLSFWPGPLTIIVHDNRTNGGTTAFRCPGDQWLRDVVSKCSGPLYSTSVNRSGNPVLGKVLDITQEFEKDVDLIVSDGDAKSSVPSTIVKMENGKIQIIREGAIKSSDLF